MMLEAYLILQLVGGEIKLVDRGRVFTDMTACMKAAVAMESKFTEFIEPRLPPNIHVIDTEPDCLPVQGQTGV